jgi:hypothetical protein
MCILEDYFSLIPLVIVNFGLILTILQENNRPKNPLICERRESSA